MKELKASSTQKERGFFDTLVDLFRSLKLTIFTLILLAILSIVGTLITQNAARADYIQRYGIGPYEVLNFFGLFDMYHSWWFTAILLLLMINLVACTLHRLPGIWRQVFRGSTSEGLEDSMLKTLPFVERVRIHDRAKAEKDVQSDLKRWFGRPGRIETESATTFFSEKGRFSRLGVPITHLSIIIILIGGMIGSIYGFRGFVSLLEGETVDRVFVRGAEGEIPKPLGFSVRCDEFKISYYELPGPEKHVKDYTSLLTVFDYGKEVLRKTVEVNHPLHYKGLAFYQASYGTFAEIAVGVQFKEKKEKISLKLSEGGAVPIPGTNAMIRLLKYAPEVHNFGEGAQVVILRGNQEPRPFWILKKFPNLGQDKDDEFALYFEGAISKAFTGLQVTKDPGVWVVWVGCGLMIFGLIFSFFFSHQKVWGRIPKKLHPTHGEEVILAGTTNKNRIGFEKAFHMLVDGLRSTGKKT